LAATLSLLGFTAALAASAGLDTSFSGDGRQTTDFSAHWSDSINDIALQSDGKIVAAGYRYNPANFNASTTDFALARYNANGSLDATFNGTGKRLTNIGKMDQIWDVAIQTDGKIVAAGITCDLSGVCDIAVARYKPNGSLDTTFNGTGAKVIEFGGDDNGTYGGLAIQSDGRIVIGGYMTNGSAELDFAAYRLNPNGSLDTSFGGDGMASVDFGAGRNDTALALALDGGKIVLAGETCDLSFLNCKFALARLTSGGAPDSTFSGDGKLITDLGGNDLAFGVAVQSDGKIVAAGTKEGSTNYFAVTRYKTNGSLDTTFNGTGKQVVSFGAVAIGEAVLIQPGGKIVVAGLASHGASHDFALARLNPNGTLDSSFSGDGKTTIDFGGKDDYAFALARQSNGRYVLGGYTFNGTPRDFALARVLP
jgi:uncharacterized delta-60 repeat protein